MKKKSGTRIGSIFKRIINIRTWSDWDRMKAFTLYLLNGFKRLFVTQKEVEVESFDSAVNKLKLSDADLVIKQNALLRLSIVMLAAAFMIFIYTGYQLFYGSFKAAIVSLVVMLIALVLAFRYHFWYFQIKHKKLGCTIKEWYRQGILGEKE
ncbi:type IVB secretion system protein IcmV [Legionella bononiensis]|uniref:Type IV secretion protein IcmV n=1 Tax=Legionella bononiensis TaxID=2793102 RepID=A0ABS1W9S3_9GAMM|nr:type IVB secretion system protein IcmV [Legionella bononiensis]MBL7480690.1 type IV secretion protein IcmV [Legionella bononiensis]MBL7526111.1 type IV secretion protein IcmV [Legionella bononiensis]MBL7563394.1 type IV secretion protein IcmV [Legionella bononiensis]